MGSPLYFKFNLKLFTEFFFDLRDSVGDGGDVAGFIIRNLNPEYALKLHKQFDSIQ